MADEPKITVNEMRRAGHCSRGIKAWFESKGYDFRTVLKEGVTAEEILKLHDGFGDQVISRVREKRRAE